MRSIRTSVRERATRRARLTNGLRRVTRPARKLYGAELAAAVDELRSKGILPRVTSNERS
jgi:hypothetical protein